MLKFRMAYLELKAGETIAAFFLVIAFCLLLKKFGVVREEHEPMFSRLLVEGALPAVIFYHLTIHTVHFRDFIPAGVILAAGLFSLMFAWLAARVFRLDRPATGAMILTSAFGSSAFLGYPIIQALFSGSPAALTSAVLISDLGVGLPIYVFGPAVAIYFGNARGNKPGHKILIEYSRSPVFIAAVSGGLLGLLNINWHYWFLTPFHEAMRIIDGSVTVLACLILALNLKIKPLKKFWPLLLISVLSLQVIHPWLAQGYTYFLHFPLVRKQVLILLCAMPSALLGPIFAARYKCAPELASAVLMGNVLIAAAMIPAAFFLFGR